MRKMRLCITLMLFFVSATALHAQWSGSVDGSGGFCMMKGLRSLSSSEPYLHHWLGKGGADLTYKDSLFTWKTSLTGSYESVDKDFLKGEAHFLDQSSTVDGVLTLSLDNPISARFRSDALWQLSTGSKLSAWIQYTFDYRHAWNVNTRFDQDMNMGGYADEQLSRSHGWGAGVSFSQQLGSPRRVLAASYSFTHSHVNQESDYFTIDMHDAEDLWADIYRITPRIVTIHTSSLVHYRDSVLTGATKLVLDPGLRVTGSRSINENSGATANGRLTENIEWRDSTEIRETFIFTSLDFQPYLSADFAVGKFQIHADYGLMLYLRQLTDDLHRQGMQFHRPYAVGNGSVKWQMADAHGLTFSNNLSVLHPSYLQVCWFDRSGGYYDRLYRGDPQLKSNTRSRYELTYLFLYKRFSSKTSVSYLHSRNEIVQTWFRETIDDRPYQVFTWINGADTKRLGVSQSFNWRGKVLTAGLGAEYGHSWRKLVETDESVHSPEWRLNANASVNLGKGWTVSADMCYQSAMSSFFAIFNDYCVVNASVKKTFKKLTLYLEGHDLADAPRIVRIQSADGSQLNTEESYYNRRLIILGLKWAF